GESRGSITELSSTTPLLRTVGRRVAVGVGRAGGQGAGPIPDAGANVPGHGPFRPLSVAAPQGLDDRQVFAGLLGQAPVVVPGLVVLPGHVPEGPEQGLEPADLV